MAATLLRTRVPRLAIRAYPRYLSTAPPPKGQDPAATNSAPAEPKQPAAPLSVPSLDFSPGERTGARSAKDSMSSFEKRRQRFGRVTTLLALLALGSSYAYLGREWEEGEVKPRGVDKDGSSSWFSRSNARLGNIFTFFTEPAAPLLLPTELPPGTPPLTLVLSLDDLLITSTWDRQHGWRTAKRPGVDYFLAYLSQFYEIVIFTTQNSYTAAPIIEKLDPLTVYVMHKLFREATHTTDGKIIKDLDYLNRDLSKVIAVDTNPEAYANHPENAVIVPKWKGGPADKGLINLIPFLESIAILQPPDVRPAIRSVAGKDVALEFAKQEAESKRLHVEAWERSRKGKKGAVGGMSLSSLFGSAGSPSQDANQPPPTFLEAKRKEAQLLYAEIQEYYKRTGPELKKMMDEERERQMKEMGGSLLGALSGMGLAAPTGEPDPSAKKT